MLVDIFSTFDDHNSVFLSMYILMWIFALYVLITLNMNFWLSPSRWTRILNTPMSIIYSQLIRSFGPKLGGFITVVSSLFLMLIFLNMVGLIPYVFSTTSHLALTFSLSFPLWLSLIISGSVFNHSSATAKLLPEGAPAALNPFLVLVETVSLCVRPLTLAVRLVANLSAGHIVLGLIGTFLSSSLFVSPTTTLFTLTALETVYTVFEIGISLIQAYIFCLLITLYVDDHPN